VTNQQGRVPPAPVTEQPDGVPLTGGRMTSGIVRHGDRVHRPAGPWTPAVHEYLRHLAAAGFAGSPRVLDDGWEELSYLDGEVAADPDWQPGRGNRLPPYARTDQALVAAGRLIRTLHEAAAGFQPTETGYRFHPHPPLPGEVVSHGDLGPWNTVYRDGLPVAFIDWDSAQPVDPVADLAAAAWAFLPLAPSGQLTQAGFDPLPDLPARLRLFVDAYGLADRQSIIPALQRSPLATAEHVKYWPIDASGAADSLEFLARELRWIHRLTPDLARAL
jgi:aminoglycoside phosphotransferase (APT) family kinase protein